MIKKISQIKPIGPYPRSDYGFTLIEIMITVAIIGILASVAIPSYQDYIARSQVTEPLQLMYGLKTPLVEWKNDKGAWPSSLASLSGTTSGRYTESVVGSGDYTLTATLRSANVSSGIAGKTLVLTTSDGGKTWHCDSATGGTVPSRYRPNACR